MKPMAPPMDITHPPAASRLQSPDEQVVPDPWAALRLQTRARIALGRSGVSLPTAELLRFGLAHAQARDAVHLALDSQALGQTLAQAGFASMCTASAAPDRATYLLRPDLGRQLTQDEAARLHTWSADQAGPADLLFVVGDGLSSLAVVRQVLPLLEAIRAQMPSGHAAIGQAENPIVIATQARVALGDEIAQALGARMVAVLIGERPGLSSPDSLSIYLTAHPHRGCTDAQRNCISNIHAAGLSAAQAAYKLWWHVLQARALQTTGVLLKDLSDSQPLANLPWPESGQSQGRT